MSTQWVEIIEILRRERLLSAAMLNSGASSEELAALERHVGMTLPTSLRQFLSEHNGQSNKAKFGIYKGSQILSTDGICAQWDTWKGIDSELMNADCAEFMSSKPEGVIKSMYTNQRWIPLTHDWAGNHVGLDFDPDTRGKIGQVIAFGRDQDEKVLLADSFDEFLHNFASELRITDWKFADEHREATELATEAQYVDVSDAGIKPWWKFW